MSRLAAWKTAARIHTLPASVVPVLVGAGLAVGDSVFRADAFSWALLGAVAIQIAANFANDVSDAKRGADSMRLGPPRMVALGEITPRHMWSATWAAVGVAALSGLALTLIAGPVVLVIGVASIIAMLGYVGGPVPYGYRGLGEVFVFVFFGLVATVGSRYVHDMSAPAAAWALSVPVGMLVTAILVVNNYRDIDTDRAAGKLTLAVMLGRKMTQRLFAVLLYGAYAVIAALGAAGVTSTPTLLAAVLVAGASPPVRIIHARTEGPALNRALKMTARLHMWTGLALAAGAALTV